LADCCVGCKKNSSHLGLVNELLTNFDEELRSHLL
jgi:hypothetical protein